MSSRDEEPGENGHASGKVNFRDDDFGDSEIVRRAFVETISEAAEARRLATENKAQLADFRAASDERYRGLFAKVGRCEQIGDQLREAVGHDADQLRGQSATGLFAAVARHGRPAMSSASNIDAQALGQAIEAVDAKHTLTLEALKRTIAGHEARFTKLDESIGDPPKGGAEGTGLNGALARIERNQTRAGTAASTLVLLLGLVGAIAALVHFILGGH